MPLTKSWKAAAKVKKGTGTPFGRDEATVGSVTMAQVEEIAKVKMPDLNTNRLQSAMNTVMGTARNMGIKVDGETATWSRLDNLGTPPAPRVAASLNKLPSGDFLLHGGWTPKGDKETFAESHVLDLGM